MSTYVRVCKLNLMLIFAVIKLIQLRTKSSYRRAPSLREKNFDNNKIYNRIQGFDIFYKHTSSYMCAFVICLSAFTNVNMIFDKVKM